MNNQDLEKKVKQLVQSIIFEKGFVCSIDILLKLGYLSQSDLESWRFGRVDYLERVCKVNLSKLSTVNRILNQTATSLKLEKSMTDYKKFGEGAKIGLTFSKSRNKSIEEFYATHFVDKKRIEELTKVKAELQ